MKIPTTDFNGRGNGWVLPIWNANDNPGLRPDQVYLTVVNPQSQKGPHCHRVRRGLFCCIKGNVRVVTRWLGEYSTHYSGDKYNHALIEVPTGVAAAIYNDGDEEAMVLNLPSPAWSKDAPDEWPVENWEP